MRFLSWLIVTLLCCLTPAQELQSPQVLQWTLPGSNVYDLTLAIYRPVTPFTWPSVEEELYKELGALTKDKGRRFFGLLDNEI